jgi:hypothetical protein
MLLGPSRPRGSSRPRGRNTHCVTSPAFMRRASSASSSQRSCSASGLPARTASIASSARPCSRRTSGETGEALPVPDKIPRPPPPRPAVTGGGAVLGAGGLMAVRWVTAFLIHQPISKIGCSLGISGIHDHRLAVGPGDLRRPRAARSSGDTRRTTGTNPSTRRIHHHRHAIFPGDLHQPRKARSSGDTRRTTGTNPSTRRIHHHRHAIFPGDLHQPRAARSSGDTRQSGRTIRQGGAADAAGAERAPRSTPAAVDAARSAGTPGAEGAAGSAGAAAAGRAAKPAGSAEAGSCVHPMATAEPI